MSSEDQNSKQNPATSPQVSIIIVSHNSGAVLDDCVQSIPAASRDVSCEIIIIDNASIDNLNSIPFPTGIPHRVLRQNRNLGFARACNVGAEAATGEYLLFLNPDVTLDSGAIKSLLAIARTHTKAGFVSGRLRFPDGTFQATCRNFPTYTNLFRSRGSILHRWFGPDIDRERQYTLGDFDDTTEVPAVAATLVMISRPLFHQLGGFDERFFLYMEDTDFSRRVHDSGYTCLFVPDAGGIHALGTGSRIGVARRRRLQSIAVWKYFLKHHPNGYSVVLLPILLAINWMLFVMFPARRGEKR